MSRAPNWRTFTKEVEEKESSSELFSTFPLDYPTEDVSSAWTGLSLERSWAFHERLANCQDAYLRPKIEEALKCLVGAYRLYGPRRMIASYNGGKDAVVILHLMRAAHAKYCQDLLSSREEEEGGQNGQSSTTVHMYRPRAIYFESDDEFPEIRDLVHSTVESYDLDMLAFESSYSFGDGLKILVDRAEEHSLAFVLGTRTADPNGHKQGMFSPSSHYMPPFMRVNPILNWSYGHVWHFLRLFHLPYCSLYDDGFTSLGDIHDTLPCPSLAKPDGGFWPAYMLRDWDQERAGRVPRKKTGASPPPTTPSTPLMPRQEEEGQPTSPKDKSTLNAPATSYLNSPKEEQPSSTSSSSSDAGCSSVGLLIIGDEILKGMCNDTNTNAAASALRTNGVLLSRVVVVPDVHDDIVKEIQKMRRDVDVIVTSGGVGPTHDDVTMHSVSTALSSPLEYHQEMASFLLEKMGPKGDDGEGLSEAQKKMATLPRHAKLRYFAGEGEWPTLQCRNVYILPGIPQIFAKKVEAIAKHLASDFVPSVSYSVVLSVEEGNIVDALNDVVRNHPNVTIGSYPFIDHPDFKTVVTIEGKEGPTLPGDTRESMRKRSVASLKVLSELEEFPTPDAPDEHEGEKSMAWTHMAVFTKEEMDVHVKLALADLVNELPKGSILRVDNEGVHL